MTPFDDELTLVDKMILALRHPVPDRAGLAIDVLTRMLHEPRAIVPLIELLDYSRDAAILKQAALALGEFGDPRAAEPLRELLTTPSTALVVRLACVEALGRIGGPVAASGLRWALSDVNQSVRGKAATVLSQLEQAPCDADARGGRQ
jgi:HEAT repeat protein